MEPKKKKKVKLYILLASIWFVVALPLPWLVNNPDVPPDVFVTILGIIAVLSVPFVILAVVWTIKPELAT